MMTWRKRIMQPERYNQTWVLGIPVMNRRLNTMYLRALIPAAAVALLATAPSFAHKPFMPPGQAKKLSRSDPGPVAALGLPAAAIIGGCVWLRRRAQKGSKQP